MSRIRKILEQHREKGRFKPVLPRMVQNNPGVSPRDEFSQNVKSKSKMKYDIHQEENIKEDLRNWFNPNHPEGGWKRINSKGEAIGPCAREPGEAKPKCMSNAKRASLTKDERASAVKAKRKHDPNPERKGKPINVSNYGKGKLGESMEQLDEKNAPTNPKLWARAKSLARSKFDVYPSAYANGWAAKWYKSKGGGWKTISEEVEITEMAGANMNTRDIHHHLKKTGWNLSRTAGGHDVYTHPKSSEHISVPRHKQLKAPLVLGILKASKKIQEENITESDLPKTTSKTEKVVTVRHKTSGKELSVVHTAVPEYEKRGYEQVKEEVDENPMEVPISVRSLYAKTYGKHAKTIRHSDEAKQKAYSEVEKKHGKDMMNRLKNYHNKNMQESKTASIARGILMRKLDTMKLIKASKPVQPKMPANPTPPFTPDPPKSNLGVTVGKRPAGMSVAKHLAKTAIRNQMKTEAVSKKADIVKKAAKKGKEKFIADPVITQTYVKTENN
jgi:predicted RNA binding protein YcfA (HicA-like mRNA interferase family)